MHRILVYSDLQATDGHERCFHDPTLSLQQWRVRKFYTDLHEIYIEHDCDALFDLGDTTDDRSRVPLPTIDAVICGLKPFPAAIGNIKLIGNHEQFLHDQSVHIGRLFESKFTIVSQTKVVLDLIDDTAILCCAYPETDAKLIDWLKETQYKYRNMRQILLGHFQAAGCEMQSGTALTGVPKSVLRKFQLGLLGHIHKPQEIVENVHYVGSPFQQNFGEAGEEKRVGIIDTKTLSVDWIPLPGYPIYRVIEFSEFRKIRTDSEDRFKVVLRSSAESEEFFAHPFASRVEPIYDYKLTDKTVKECAADCAWTTNDVMRRYLKKVTPASKGITIAEDEMLEYGQTIAEIT